MKLHRFRTNFDSVSYMAFTRDRGGKALKNKSIRLRDPKLLPEEVHLYNADWKYIGPFSTTGLSDDEVKPVHAMIKDTGVCISVIIPIPEPIYVFDASLVIGNTRVYSLDRDLKRFKSACTEYELHPGVGPILGSETQYIGQLEGKFSYELVDMGIDVRRLFGCGFVITEIYDIPKTEVLRRHLQRKFDDHDFSEIEEQFGIKVGKVIVDSVAPMSEKKEKDSSASNAPETFIPPIVESITNLQATLENVLKPDLAIKKPKRWKKVFTLIAGLTAFFASLAAIVEFFSG